MVDYSTTPYYVDNNENISINVVIEDEDSYEKINNLTTNSFDVKLMVGSDEIENPIANINNISRDDNTGIIGVNISIQYSYCINLKTVFDLYINCDEIDLDDTLVAKNITLAISKKNIIKLRQFPNNSNSDLVNTYSDLIFEEGEEMSSITVPQKRTLHFIHNTLVMMKVMYM